MTLDDILQKHGIAAPGCWSDLPPGWTDIVDRLFVDLVAMGWDRHLDQVKEKFGELRVYASGPKEIWDRIDEATEESRRTCEECGKPGKHSTKGWHTTRCEEHAR
jgi:hypothetical protein